MVHQFIVVCCFCLGLTLRAQVAAPLTLVFPEKDSRPAIDALGNIYLIHGDELRKYNPQGTFLKTFSNKRYGRIEDVDLSNPLKILVYYKDFQQVLFLDNQLSPAAEVISLERAGHEQTALVCSSVNNSFWIYDKQNNELLRFGPDLKVLVQTGNLKRLLELDLQPNYMREHGNFLYLNCPQEGILVFDIYGTFYKTIPIRGLHEFTVINGNVFYFENFVLKEHEAKAFQTINKAFPDALLKTVYWRNERYYKVYADSLQVSE